MADVALDKCIIDQCSAVWGEEFIKGVKNRDNCSGFVKAVAKKLGILLPETANADGIADAVKAGWVMVDSGVEAARQAGMGNLVLAVLKASDHTPPRQNGHVAIVVSGELYRSKYPKVWCGSLGSAQSQGELSVSEVWGQTDRDNVKYYAYTSVVCK